MNRMTSYSTQALCCLTERSSQQVQASMTAPVNAQCSTEWFPKWTHNYLKLMDLKSSSIVISLTLPIAKLILGCQFSLFYHRKMVNHERHTLFLWTNEGYQAHGQCAAQGSLAGHLKFWGQKSWNQVSGRDLGAWVLAVARHGKLGWRLPVKVTMQWSQRGAGVGPSMPAPEQVLSGSQHALPLGGTAGIQLAGALQSTLLHNQQIPFTCSLSLTRESRLWSRAC